MASVNASLSAVRQLWSSHPRQWEDFAYVYPVISRRSRGLSIGINLNPDRRCSFNCVYCSVDHLTAPVTTRIHLARLQTELLTMLELVRSGQLWQHVLFTRTPQPLRRLNDIAFSGDGEPTLYAKLDHVVRITLDCLSQFPALKKTKLILITNATGLHLSSTLRALELMDQHPGEIWAKLDAGTDEYYRDINRSRFPYQRILKHILLTGRQRPLIIQSLFLRFQGRRFPMGEFDAYIGRLRQLLEGGCRIKAVHLYTIARPPKEKTALPLSNLQLDRLADRLRKQIPQLPVEVFYKS